MPLVESTINNCIAEILDRMSQNWTVSAENIGQLRESKSLTVDIFVTGDSSSPVLVENEFLPARTVDSDAIGRLGKTLEGDGSLVTEVVALRTPSEFKRYQTAEEAKRHIHSHTFEYAHFSIDSSRGSQVEGERQVFRSPGQPGDYYEGSIFDFAAFLASAGFNRLKLLEAIDVLNLGVKDSIAILQRIFSKNQDLKREISNMLRGCRICNEF